MKRDLSLVRSILLRVEAEPPRSHIEVEALLDLDPDREVIAAHVGLMADAGLLSVIDTSTMDGRD